MSEDGEEWALLRQESKIRRHRNEEWSIHFLREQGIQVKVLSKDTAHYRVGDFDFWPSTGLFYDQKTKVKGRGVKNLIKLL